jgi:hypothetical protein
MFLKRACVRDEELANFSFNSDNTSVDLQTTGVVIIGKLLETERRERMSACGLSID